MNRITREYLDQYRQALLARRYLPLTIGADPQATRQRVYSAEDALRRSVKAGTKADQEITKALFRLHEHVSSLTPQQALKEQYE